MRKPTLLALALLLAVTACSFQNSDEKEAQKITEAVMANDLAPVRADISPGVNITRIQVAEWSSELAEQGKLKSLKENPTCTPGVHCFDVVFEKHTYTETMQRDEKGKILKWAFHMVDPSATPTPK